MVPLHDHEGPTRELRRVLDRAGGLPLGRWDRAGDDGITPEAAFRAVVQELADLAADAQGRRRREVPQLRVHALPDQLAVLARDALTGPDPHTQAAVNALLVGLRRRL